MFTSYLKIWLTELCEWVGFYSKERSKTVERLSKVTGAASGYRSAAATRVSTSSWGIECMVANTHRVLHSREISQQPQLA